MNYLSLFLDKTDQIVNLAILRSWVWLDLEISGWAEAMLTLYIIMLGVQIWCGLNDDILSIGKNGFRGFLIYAFATNMPMLLDLALELTQDVPESIGNTIVAAFGRDAEAKDTINDFYRDTAALAQTIWKRASWSTLHLYIIGGAVFLLSLIFTVGVMLTLIMAKLGFAILFSLAPIFVPCLMFSPTKRAGMLNPFGYTSRRQRNSSVKSPTASSIDIHSSPGS